VIKQITKTIGVPYSDCYEIVSVFQFTKIDDTKGTLIISTEVNYIKFILGMVKGIF